MVSLICCILLLLGSSLPAFAETEEELLRDARDIVEFYMNTDDVPLRSDVRLALGNQVSTYAWEDGVLSVSPYAAYYPVFDGDKVIGIFTKVDPFNKDFCYNYSEEFAEELNQFIAEGHTNYCIITEKNSVYVKDGPDVERVQAFYSVPDDFKSDPEVIIPQLAALEIATERSAASDSVLGYLDIKVYPESRAKRELNVKSSFQGSTNLCWAHTIVCIGEYKQPKNYSPMDLCNRYVEGNTQTGATPAQASSYMEDAYGIATTKQAILPDADIEDLIFANWPLYTQWDPLTGHPGTHAMTLRGVDFASAASSVSLMDSDVGTYFSVKKQGMQWKYNTGNGYRTWKYTLEPDGVL